MLVRFGRLEGLELTPPQPPNLILLSDSGQHRGGRSIRGGRATPRRLLYMTALAAIRWNHDSRACQERLTARGKPPKVALVAVMRNLASLLNILLREDRLWQAEAPIRQLEAAA